MTTIDPTTVRPGDLAPMLRAWSSGLYASEAAAGLLIAHGVWLRRRDFLARLVDAVDDGWGPRGTVVPMAAVLWEDVAAFAADAPASSSELAILRLAASLAGQQGDASLRELTAGLDEANGRHVLDAVAHRFGWHESGTTHLVSGFQLDGPRAPVDEPPTFEDLRAHARRLLHDAADRLRAPYRPGSGPCGEAAGHVRVAFAAIGTARDALDDAATAQARRHAGRGRHVERAEAESAQYPRPPAGPDPERGASHG